MHIGVMFLTLRVFSATGGIERVCRIAGKAMFENCTENNTPLKIYSLYDSQVAATDNRYFPADIFTGFNINKPRFIRRAIIEGYKSKIIILSHVNLLVIGWLVKKIRPSVKIIL